MAFKPFKFRQSYITDPVNIGMVLTEELRTISKDRKCDRAEAFRQLSMSPDGRRLLSEYRKQGAVEPPAPRR